MTQFIPQIVVVDSTGAPVLLAGQVNDSTGTFTLTPGALAQTIAYVAGTSQVNSVTAGPDTNGFYYKQTISYSGTNVIGITAWVKQP